MKTKTYRKPDFTMMKFAPSDNVAAGSCENQYQTLEIPCLISSSHYIFYDSCGTGNNYDDLGSNIKEVESTLYFSSAMQAVEYLSGKKVNSSTTQTTQYSYELLAGEYLVWTSGQTHAAYITPAVSSGINASA